METLKALKHDIQQIRNVIEMYVLMIKLKLTLDVETSYVKCAF